MLKSSVGKVTIQHRFRFEHRFVEDIKSRTTPTGTEFYTDGQSFANRFRYRFIIAFDLWSFSNGQSILFNGFDELWINQADNLMPTSFSRNWIYTGIGYKFNKDFNLQLAHMRQQDHAGNNSYITSSIIQLSVFKNFSLYHKK